MLILDGVVKTFGGLMAVDHVSFELGEVGITGLVGPNGSGKTTLFHLITGFYRADRGEIRLGDRRITGLPPHVISRAGLVRTFQHTRLLPFLTVTENLLAAAPRQRGENLIPVLLTPRRVAADEAALKKKAERILALLKLDHLTDALGGRLSYGQGKLLELGRVLMADPRLVLLDEPTAGINPTLIRRLVDAIGRLVEDGIRIFLIEHNMPLVAELCDRVLVMDAGALIFEGTPAAARSDERVIEAYLGRSDHVA